MANRFEVQKAALGGVTFFDGDHLDPDQGRLVVQQLNEASMWNEDKRLVVLPPHVRVLLPSDVLPDHQRPNAFVHQEVDDGTTRGMEIGDAGSGAMVGQMV